MASSASICPSVTQALKMSIFRRMALMLWRLSFMVTLPLSCSVKRTFRKVKLWCLKGVMVHFLSFRVRPRSAASRWLQRSRSRSSSREGLMA